MPTGHNQRTTARGGAGPCPLARRMPTSTLEHNEQLALGGSTVKPQVRHAGDMNINRAKYYFNAIIFQLLHTSARVAGHINAYFFPL
jgi:hypothetical protein